MEMEDPKDAYSAEQDDVCSRDLSPGSDCNTKDPETIADIRQK